MTLENAELIPARIVIGLSIINSWTSLNLKEGWQLWFYRRYSVLFKNVYYQYSFFLNFQNMNKHIYITFLFLGQLFIFYNWYCSEFFHVIFIFHLFSFIQIHKAVIFGWKLIINYFFIETLNLKTWTVLCLSLNLN